MLRKGEGHRMIGVMYLAMLFTIALTVAGGSTTAATSVRSSSSNPLLSFVQTILNSAKNGEVINLAQILSSAPLGDEDGGSSSSSSSSASGSAGSLMFAPCGLFVDGKALVLVGNGQVVFDCGGQEGQNRSRAITAIGSSDLTLSGIEFRNGVSADADGGGGAILAVNCTRISLISNTFVNNSYIGSDPNSGGGAVAIVINEEQATAVSVSFVDCTFVENSAPNPNSNGGGGVMIFFTSNANEGSVHVVGCSFDGNSAQGQNGGGGLLFGVANTATNTTFAMRATSYVNNTAMSNGGGISVNYLGAAINNTFAMGDFSSFYSNIATYGNGGGVGLTYDEQAIQNTFLVSGTGIVFSENAAQGGSGGGGVGVTFYGVAHLNSVRLLSSEVSSRRRALSYQERIDWAIDTMRSGRRKNIHSSNSVSRRSSSSSSSSPPPPPPPGITFVGNSNPSNGGGGAFYVGFLAFFLSMVSSSNNIMLSGGNYVSNFAGGEGVGGAAIFVEYVWQAFNNSINMGGSTLFASNMIANKGSGGAFFMQFLRSASGNSLTMDDCAFLNNSAPSGGWGGAVMIQGSTGIGQTFTIHNVLFSHNYASGLRNVGGGALQIDAGNANYVDVHNCLFYKNSAAGSGGALVLLLPDDSPAPSSCAACGFYGHIFPMPDPSCNFPVSSTLCTPSVPHQVALAFLPIIPNSGASLSNLTFEENSASCSSCSGGAFLINNGKISISNLVATGNSAGLLSAVFASSGTANIILNGYTEFSRNFARSPSVWSTTGSITINGNFSSKDHATIANSVAFAALSIPGSGQLTLEREAYVLITCPSGFQAVDESLGVTPTFIPEWPNPMHTTNLQLTCQPCPQGTYSPISGTFTFTNGSITPQINIMQCLPCPYGAICLGNSTVWTAPNFWASTLLATTTTTTTTANPSQFAPVASSSSLSYTSGNWSSSVCPSGYCCDPSGQDKGCKAGGETQCASGRDAGRPLCGACLEGYTQDLHGASCTPTDQCSAGEWLWPILAILSFFFGAGLLASSGPRDGYSNRKIGMGATMVRATAIPGGIVGIIPASRLSIVKEDPIPSSVLLPPPRMSITQTTPNTRAFVLVAFQFVKGMMDWSWLAPVLSFFFQNITLLYNMSGRSLVNVVSATLLSVYNLRVSWTQVCAIPNLTTEGSLFIPLVIPSAVGASLFVLFAIAWISLSQPRFTSWAMIERFFAASLKLLTWFFTTIASVTASLLRCVSVPSYGLRLFRAGAVSCYTKTQVGMWIVFSGFVVPFPIALLVVQFISRREDFSSKYPILSSSLRAIELPYRRDRWYWPSIVLFQRLVLAMIYAFITDLSLAPFLFNIACMVYVSFHIFLWPFLSTQANLVDLASQIVQMITSLAILRTGTLASDGVSVLDGSETALLSSGLDLLETILFYLPPLLTVIFVLRNAFVDYFFHLHPNSIVARRWNRRNFLIKSLSASSAEEAGIDMSTLRG